MSLTCQAIDDPAEFAALKTAWNELLAAGPTANPFLTWEWMHAWWQHYAAPDSRIQLAIVTVREGRELIALLPAYVRESGVGPASVRTLAFLGTPYESTDYIELIQRDPTRTDTLSAVFGYVQSELRPDRLELGNVLSTCVTSAFVREHLARTGAACETYPLRVCPYLPIAGTWQDYEAGLSASFRQNLRRRTRQFFGQDGAEFDWVQQRDEVPQAVRTLFDLHRRRFAHKNADTGFVADVRGEFHACVSLRLFDSDMLRLFRLRVRGNTVATLYCHESDGCLFYYQGGIDPAWHRQSVGTVLMGQVIKHAFDRGLRLFDFMRGDEAYKFHWTNRTRDIVRFDVGCTRKGQGLVALARTALTATSRAKRWARLAHRSLESSVSYLRTFGAHPVPVAHAGAHQGDA